MAIILNIDSSLECASVSIANNGVILQYETNLIQKEHASFIHCGIKKLLTDLNLSVNDIDAIACTIGPGSYTGIRVCLSAAKGLCYALNKPLITIGTLEAMAKTVILNNNNSSDTLYCPMIDARRMEVYTGLYNYNLEALIDPHAAIIDSQFCENYLVAHKIIFFGNGMDKFQQISTSSNSSFFKIDEIFSAINILSHHRFENQEFSGLSSSTPLYAKEFYNN